MKKRSIEESVLATTALAAFALCNLAVAGEQLTNAQAIKLVVAAYGGNASVFNILESDANNANGLGQVSDVAATAATIISIHMRELPRFSGSSILFCKNGFDEKRNMNPLRAGCVRNSSIEKAGNRGIM